MMTFDDLVARLRGSSHTLTFVDDKGAETVRTFHDLFEDVLATVERGKAIGLVPGARVGIAAPNGYPWMVWDLACIELGCVSVAFPNDGLPDTCGALIERYRLSALAVDARWLDAAETIGGRIVDIDPAGRGDSHTRIEPVRVEHAPDTHSLVFSSGTTGRTKGLVMSRGGTAHLLGLYGDAFGVAPGERFLTFLPFANYQQRMTYYFCLYHGIDLVSVPFHGLFPGLKRHRPTFVIAPPVLYETLHTLARAAAGPGSDASTLAERLSALTGGNIRYMVTGMAPIKRAALDFFWDCGIELYEAFGITEAGMVAWNKPGHVRVGTVGQPAEPGSVSLLEDGEVVVTRNALLSLGYFDAPEEDSRATFIAPNAVATGDIAEFDGDGFLRVVGRKKDAIITSNGEKFHPEPIEALLYRDPRVDVAVVMAGPQAGLSVVIATRRPDDPEVTDALRELVRAVNGTLPAQRQLVKVIFTDRAFDVESGLRTRNLKLNRRAIADAFLRDA
ncbi:AMP-binding protein [Burkholderia sp. BCCIQ04A]|uniref:AMP-binding protein n=1 Tax=Burkholderia anthinoferrum TaxID=3090833 RepID=A0ABU5WWA7_9BURK|nr:MULTISPECIES: AMP-binding protein [Burkholderia]MEB2506784.1 AMP-binding protein [Burkholderia anthinoferrum]MEB2535984.1 AMP-binding protein [Burkholderia anthinoferrum]MEB2564744.1 AMP-binding protein [Burkholderia anthinoferrum]MEB2583286.1 AMP-binding protein [Burkholderia anthinoferrum]KVN56782.1 long-chain fatty acid--CoA ligase [Burkholderia anthina]